MSSTIRELRVLSTMRPLSALYHNQNELMSLHCIKASFLTSLTSLLTVCLWVSVLPSVRAEEVMESQDALGKNLFRQYRFDPAFKAVIDSLPSNYWDEDGSIPQHPHLPQPELPTGWLNYSASIFEGWGYYLERGITLSVQGFITILLSVCLLLTTWWFVVPQLESICG